MLDGKELVEQAGVLVWQVPVKTLEGQKPYAHTVAVLGAQRFLLKAHEAVCLLAGELQAVPRNSGLTGAGFSFRLGTARC